MPSRGRAGLEWTVPKTCTALSCQAHDQVLEDGFLLLDLPSIPFHRDQSLQFGLLIPGQASGGRRSLDSGRTAQSHQTGVQILTLSLTGVTLGHHLHLADLVFLLVKVGVTTSPSEGKETMKSVMWEKAPAWTGSGTSE